MEESWLLRSHVAIRTRIFHHKTKWLIHHRFHVADLSIQVSWTNVSLESVGKAFWAIVVILSIPTLRALEVIISSLALSSTSIVDAGSSNWADSLGVTWAEDRLTVQSCIRYMKSWYHPSTLASARLPFWGSCCDFDILLDDLYSGLWLIGIHYRIEGEWSASSSRYWSPWIGLPHLYWYCRRLHFRSRGIVVLYVFDQGVEDSSNFSTRWKCFVSVVRRGKDYSTTSVFEPEILTTQIPVSDGQVAFVGEEEKEKILSDWPVFLAQNLTSLHIWFCAILKFDWPNNIGLRESQISGSPVLSTRGGIE